MSVIAVNTWLVRSYTHQYELKELLGKVPLEIAGQKVTDKLCFDILNYKGYGAIHVSMDPFGLVSFTTDSDAEDLDAASKEFMADVEQLFVETIMKSIQKVSYNQIKENVMPISFHRVVLSKTFRPGNLPETKAGSLSVYYDDQKLYSTDSAFYVCGSEDPMVLEAVDYFSFTVLAGKYVAEMVSMMSDLYRRVDVIVKDIDSMGDSSVYSREHLKTLRGSIIETDFIRRECSERYGKIQQATKNFQHKREAYLGEKFGGSSAEIAPHLRVEDAFKRLESDSDYLVPLWRDVLINNLENLSFAVNARINFQESLETQKEQKEVRLLRHITVLALAAAVLKLGNQQGFNPVDMIVYGLLAIILSGIIIFVIEYFSGSFRRR